MSKMIQIRNVPDELHRELKARSAAAGMTLSDYLKRELERLVERPDPEDVRRRLSGLKPVRGDVDPVVAVREERERR